MLFKNAYIYRLTKDLTISTEEMEARLEKACFTPCGPHDVTRNGWVPPLGSHGNQYVHQVLGERMLRLDREDKVLPGAVVSDALKKKVSEIENSQLRTVGRKEQRELRDQIVTELLPKAFTRTQSTYGFLSFSEGLLIVDAASPRKADDFCSALRQALGSLPIRMPVVKASPADVMTQWLQGSRPLPDGFQIEGDCELRSLGDPAIVRCKSCDLHGEEFKSHLEAGKRAVKLSLNWREQLSFVLSEDLTIKRLRFGDILAERIAEIETDGAADRFDADFAIMAPVIVALFREVMGAFGGEDRTALGVVA